MSTPLVNIFAPNCIKEGKIDAFHAYRSVITLISIFLYQIEGVGNRTIFARRSKPSCRTWFLCGTEKIRNKDTTQKGRLDSSSQSTNYKLSRLLSKGESLNVSLIKNSQKISMPNIRIIISSRFGCKILFKLNKSKNDQ